jgi:hypothetical protein
MSTIRPLLLSLAALFTVPATAHAQDDDVCVGWVHVFIDAEVDGDKVTVTSDEACLMRGSSLDDLDPFADGKKPYPGGAPGFSSSRVCAARDREVDEMRRVLTEANQKWAEAVAARDAVAAKVRDALAAYEEARGAWLAAQLVTAAAKTAYEDVYEVVVEIERDRDGHVVVVHRIGYRANTALGRAVLAAIEREEAARKAMAEAWAKWAEDATPAAQAAQFRVDQYRTTQVLYPTIIKEALAEAATLGCK